MVKRKFCNKATESILVSTVAKLVEFIVKINTHTHKRIYNKSKKNPTMKKKPGFAEKFVHKCL